MKECYQECYQLIFTTENGDSHDVIFNTLTKATRYLNEKYKVGYNYFDGKITSSFIVSRILF